MLNFTRELVESRIVLPDGEAVDRTIEIRTHPITGRTCRIAYSRGAEREPGGESLPAPPPFAADSDHCPFCPANLASHTPRFPTELCPEGRMVRGSSILFPNLFPYGRYSAVSLFDDDHFVEIGTAPDGKDALTKLTGSVNMVITDLNMPNMDGIALIRAIRSQAAYKFIPIVLLTTESQDAKKQEGKAAGATGWIVKPFKPAQKMVCTC